MPVDKTCERCGTPFRVKPKDANQRFCTRLCKISFEKEFGRLGARVPETDFICKQCSSPFSFKPAYVRAYEKKFGILPKYCSMKCSDLGRRADAEARAVSDLTCIQCGKTITDVRKPSGYLRRGRCLCSSECRAMFRRLSYQTKFPEGNSVQRIGRNGYIRWVVPGKNGEPARETFYHRYVMEQHIGRRLLSDETVHHINGDRSNNDLSNLELFSSRHGPGQRVRDKVAFAIEILRLYPEFGREAGVELHDLQRLAAD